MVGWHHQLNGHEQALGDGDGQGGLACCSPWGCKESDMTLDSRPTLTHSVLGGVLPTLMGVNSPLLTGRTDAEAKAPILWPPDAKN